MWSGHFQEIVVETWSGPVPAPCDCEFSLRETFSAEKTGSSGFISRDCRFSIHKQFTNISLTLLTKVIN